MSNDTLAILRLTISRRWFLMIARLEKPEEYRDLKPFYHQRLLNPDGSLKRFDRVELTNGYGRSHPRITLECKGIKIGQGNCNWGAPANQDVYILELGGIIKIENADHLVGDQLEALPSCKHHKHALAAVPNPNQGLN